jgi:hypothetical protein
MYVLLKIDNNTIQGDDKLRVSQEIVAQTPFTNALINH